MEYYHKWFIICSIAFLISSLVTIGLGIVFQIPKVLGRMSGWTAQRSIRRQKKALLRQLMEETENDSRMAKKMNINSEKKRQKGSREIYNNDTIKFEIDDTILM